MAKRYFLYARKSQESEERQVLSLESQVTELRDFAHKEKLEIANEFIEAMTAKAPGRPIFNELLNRLEKGEADGIIAWHPDRLARNSVDGGRIIYMLDTGAIEALKFPTFWFENTPQGKFMMNIAFGQSKYYVDNLSENVKRGLRQKLRRGEWPGWAPMGYLNDRNLHKVVVDPIKGPLVTKLFEACATGKYSLADLRTLSHSMGLVSRPEGPLVKAELVRTLTRPFYYGLMKYKEEWHEGTHEPLISKVLFEKVQRVLNSRTRNHEEKKHFFPYLNFATCPCSAAITAEKQKGHTYYRCTRKKGPCQQPYTREELLDNQMTEAIRAVALPKEGFDEMLSYLEEDKVGSRQMVQTERVKIEEPLNHVNAQLERLLDLHLNGSITHHEYAQKKEKLLDTKTTLQEQLKTIGSNFRLNNRTLEFSYTFPWPLLSSKGGPAAPAFGMASGGQKSRPGKAGKRLTECQSENSRGRKPKNSLENKHSSNWRSTYHEVRTYFQSKHGIL